MDKSRIFATVLVLVLIMSIPLAAQNRGKMAARDHDCKATCMKGLSEEQTDKMARLKLKHHQELVDLKADVKKIHLKIKEEFMADEPDRRNLEKLVSKLSSAKESIHMKKLGFMMDSKEILGEEHWKVFLKHHLDGFGGMSHGECRGTNKGCMGGKGMRGCRGGRGMKGGCGSGHGMGMKGGCGSAGKIGCARGSGARCVD